MKQEARTNLPAHGSQSTITNEGVLAGGLAPARCGACAAAAWSEAAQRQDTFPSLRSDG